ncbi:MAG: hypothetical protein ACRD24_16415 [Terriglobales bacterium]
MTESFAAAAATRSAAAVGTELADAYREAIQDGDLGALIELIRRSQREPELLQQFSAIDESLAIDLKAGTRETYATEPKPRHRSELGEKMAFLFPFVGVSLLVYLAYGLLSGSFGDRWYLAGVGVVFVAGTLTLLWIERYYGSDGPFRSEYGVRHPMVARYAMPIVVALICTFTFLAFRYYQAPATAAFRDLTRGFEEPSDIRVWLRPELHSWLAELPPETAVVNLRATRDRMFFVRLGRTEPYRFTLTVMTPDGKVLQREEVQLELGLPSRVSLDENVLNYKGDRLIALHAADLPEGSGDVAVLLAMTPSTSGQKR